jgi:dUTP pyrophosphatase
MKIKKLYEEAVTPTRATEGSAGWDLYSTEEFELWLGCSYAVPTGIAVEIPPGYAGFIWPRSGLAKRRLDTLAGLIDSDYRGEVKVVLINHSEDLIKIPKGTRIAQLVIAPILSEELEVVEELSSTYRGVGGFGSTGE